MTTTIEVSAQSTDFTTKASVAIAIGAAINEVETNMIIGTVDVERVVTLNCSTADAIIYEFSITHNRFWRLWTEERTNSERATDALATGKRIKTVLEMHSECEIEILGYTASDNNTRITVRII